MEEGEYACSRFRKLVDSIVPEFSPRSWEKLATCHADLQRLFNEVIKEMDCTIVCGHRTQAEQDKVYPQYSNAKWPDSPHNQEPSLAVDAMPCPIDWDDIPRVLTFRDVVEDTARSLNIGIRPLIRFRNRMGQIVTDYPHFELA